MKKLHKIITIPIQKKTIDIDNLIKLDNNEYRLVDQIMIDFINNEFDGNLQAATQQQLLLLSDDEIKENTNTFKEGINGDWFYNTKFQTIQNIGDITDFDFKIIASYPQLDNLPIFSKEFIENWIKNPINEVEIYYEEFKKQYTRNEDDSYDCLTCNTTGIERNAYATEWTKCKCPEHQLTLNSNNEVICSIPKVQLVEFQTPDWTNCELFKYLQEITSTNKEFKDFSNNYIKVKEVTYTESEVLDIIDDLFHCYASSYRHEAKEYFLESYKKK